jgi:hypothetical protein
MILRGGLRRRLSVLPTEERLLRPGRYCASLFLHWFCERWPRRGGIVARASATLLPTGPTPVVATLSPYRWRLADPRYLAAPADWQRAEK